MKHTDILTHLAIKNNLKSYLEIGVQNAKNNLDKIPCETKVGVDPEPFTSPNPNTQCFIGTSDEFFDCECSKAMTFDLIFIDGLHHADQVKKDFENALKRLNPGGFIVIHDCNPEKEEITIVPRQTKEWTGNVYKFVSTLSSIPGLLVSTVDTDYGVCIVQDNPDEVNKYIPGLPAKQKQPSWKQFDKNRNNLLNLITVEQFLNIY